MAHKREKDQAITLRKKGMSYNQIREEIKVSKSTLSLWLQDYPLSPERLHELRDINPRRIEKYRETMKQKREVRISIQKDKVIRDIGVLTKREFFVAGFFLFWGEGTKVRKSEVSLANTDPSIIRSFLKWLEILGIKREECKFTLHIYADMDPIKEIQYWAKELNVSPKTFNRPYVKKSNFIDITYKTGFGHGTCSARYMSQNLNDYVLMGIKYIRELYGR